MRNDPIPALIVGLGGSGAWTVVHVKKQLYETYDNRIPDGVELLVLDTAKKPMAQAGAQGLTRVTGSGFGQVVLEDREYGHLGGNAKPMMERAARDPKAYSHLSSWLLADYYLKNLPENLFQLEDGAGQYRQLGRLALFRDVAAESNSNFYNLVRSKINAIKSKRGGERQLAVFITGSLAGGTGAGLFIDIAHLIRRIAEQAQMEVQLRGYFYLPEAFSGTLNPTDLNHARPRAFGALRELSRFILNQDWQFGYPMYYHDARTGVNPEIWRAENRGKLYDLIYLVDGHRQFNPLANRALEKGAAPSVADAIMSFIDSQAGEYQRQYIVNLGNKISERQRREGLVPFIGAVGTYSIILPIQQMVEAWAYRLAVWAMEQLVPAEKVDEVTGLPVTLKIDANPERSGAPFDEVENFLAHRNVIVDPRDPKKRISPTRLWPEVFRLYNEKLRQEAATVRILSSYTLDNWLEMLIPPSSDADREARRAIQATESVLSESILEEVRPSDEVSPKQDPSIDNIRIKREVMRFLDRQLGPMESSGQRSGGRYRSALDEFVKFQVGRFREGLAAYVMGHLNGQDKQDPIGSRTGKLGWLIGVLSELRNVLGSVLELIGKARGSEAGRRGMREEAITGWEDAEREMDRLRNETGTFLGLGTPKAIRAQRDYLMASEYVLEVFRTEFARDAVEETIRGMYEFTQSVLDALEVWREVLATDQESLTAVVKQNSRRIESERDRAEEVSCRRVIRDKDWETERYRMYLERSEAARDVMENLWWEVEEGEDERGRPKLVVRFKMGKEDGKYFRYDRRGKWSEENANTLLDFCRGVFGRAKEDESVLNYLSEYEYKDRPEELAEELYRNSGVLLDFNEADVGQFMPALYLLAYQDGRYPEQQRFLRRVMGDLRGKFNIVDEGGDESFARLQGCDDRFRLTLVNMAELLPLDRIEAYRSDKQRYMKESTTSRKLFHIFPAEVTAVPYEDRLTAELKQERRIISDKIAILLEDKRRFKEFLYCMAHDVITWDRDYIDKVNTLFTYYLEVPSQKNEGKEDEYDVWWLCKPMGSVKKQEALLEAMTTYIYRERDVGYEVYEPDYEFPIDYKRVREWLREVREEDAEDRIKKVENGEAELHSEDMAKWLNELEKGSEEYTEIAKLAAEHDILYEFAEELEEEIPVIKEELDKFKPEAGEGEQAPDRMREQTLRELYDLYSVAYIALREEIKGYYEDAKNRFQAYSGRNRIGSGEKSKDSNRLPRRKRGRRRRV